MDALPAELVAPIIKLVNPVSLLNLKSILDPNTPWSLSVDHAQASRFHLHVYIQYEFTYKTHRKYYYDAKRWKGRISYLDVWFFENDQTVAVKTRNHVYVETNGQEKLRPKDLIRMGFRETTKMSASKWIRKIARLIFCKGASDMPFTRRYEHKKGRKELTLGLKIKAHYENVSLRGVCRDYW
uniref:F-box domain-containing protein n=1 Tax=Steinernema glaseri TaxID=37863 RepID=A0A1I7ZLL0_9BILA